MQIQHIKNEFDYCLTKLFDLPASHVIITGGWKTGKTDFALLVAERLLKLGIISRCASNIETKDSRISYIYDLPSLKYWLYQGDERKLYIFDEAGSHLHRRRSMSKKNIAFVTLFPEISKARARMITIMQNLASIDSELLSETWTKGLAIKPTRYTVYFISDLLPEELNGKEFLVPRTNIPFDPYKLAPFSLTRKSEIPTFLSDDKNMKILWEWAVNNKTVIDLGLHPQQLNRIVRAFVKQTLEDTAQVISH